MVDPGLEPNVDLTALERELCRIPEVTAARVVAGTDGGVEEVHILSSPAKHAKQVVRDVQSVAMATFNLDLDRRIVSVVQLDAASSATLPAVDEDDDPGSTNGATAPLAAARINVDSVSVARAGLQCTAEVVLRRGDQKATGTAEGLVATSNVLRLVAQATIASLRELEPAAARAEVEAAKVIALGDRTVALSTIVIVVPPYEEICAGSAVVRAAGELDAVARAVLDATNRRLPQLR